MVCAWKKLGGRGQLSTMKKTQIDPLFQIFEHSLVTRSYEDSQAFTKTLALNYLTYLDSTPAHVPFQVRAHVLEDLEAEVHEMLVKKMYGCVEVVDYKNTGNVMWLNQKEELEVFEFVAPLKSQP